MPEIIIDATAPDNPTVLPIPAGLIDATALAAMVTGIAGGYAEDAHADAIISATQAGISTGAAATATTQQGIATAQAANAAGSAADALSSQQSAAAAAAVSGRPYPPLFASQLPQGITGITIGGTSITGATPGTYPLTFTGGSYVGVSASLVVDTPTSARIVFGTTAEGRPAYGLNISGGATLPTIANPTGATLPSGTTLTAVPGTLITPEIQTYWVQGADGSSVALYGNHSGVATPAGAGTGGTFFGGTQLTMSGKQSVQDYDTLNPDLINTVAVVGSDGYVIATLPPVNQPLTGQVYDTLAYPGQTIFVGSDGYIIAVIDSATLTALNGEVTTARGSRPDLDTRLSGGLTAYGLQRGPFKRTWALHRWRRDWASVLYQLDSPATRPIVATLGDSYSTGPYYWTYWLKRRLDTITGTNGGIGWCGFGDPGGSIGINGNVYITGNGAVTVTKSGAGWASNYGSAPAQVHPALSDAYSSTVADRYTVAVTKNDRPALSNAILHYGGGENGVVRYRYNGGAWTTLNLTGSGVQLASLTGFPTGTANFTLDIEVDPTNTGTVRLYGVDLVSAVVGTVFHKLGATGQKISQHAAASATASWATALASLAPSLMTIGTPINDRNGGFTPAQYAANVQTIITNARAVLPQLEFLLWLPGEIIGAGPTYPFATHMREYRKACEPLLDANDGVAMLDFQYLLPGDGDPTKYGGTTGFPFLNATDNTHPSNPFGARVMEEGFWRALIN